MYLRTLRAPVRPGRLLATALVGGSVGLVSATAFAQQPAQPPAQAPAGQPPAQQRPARPATPPAAQQRPAQKPATPAQPPAESQQPPAGAQAPGAAPGGQTVQAAETPPLIYSPWTKVCGKEGQPNAGQKEVCFTIKEARLDTGQFVASAGLIELEGEQKKILRVTLPLGLLLRNGTRMVIDSQQPMMGAYSFCLPNGCWADFEVNGDFVGRLKKGQSLVLQAFNLNGQVASFAFPLADFAKSNDGPPTDPKVLEEQQKKLQEELQKRADDARKKMEQQGGATPGAATTPPKAP